MAYSFLVSEERKVVAKKLKWKYANIKTINCIKMTELKMTELKTRFPITHALCEKHNKRYRKNEPDIVIQNGITYDKSVLPVLSQWELDTFIELQEKNQEIINMCFIDLTHILEQQEKQIVTRDKKKKKKTHNHDEPMKLIYDRLIKLNQHNDDLCFIDKWVLFIKSQGEFSQFF